MTIPIYRFWGRGSSNFALFSPNLTVFRSYLSTTRHPNACQHKPMNADARRHPPGHDDTRGLTRTHAVTRRRRTHTHTHTHTHTLTFTCVHAPTHAHTRAHTGAYCGACMTGAGVCLPEPDSGFPCGPVVGVYLVEPDSGFFCGPLG